MRCIIVDDDKVFVRILQELINKFDYLELTESFADAEAAKSFLKDEDVDLIFLDVEFPGESGMDLIQYLNKNTQVILVTGKEKYAVEAFEYNVVDYLVKPISADRFNRAVKKAKEYYDLKSSLQINKNRLFMKENNAYHNVLADDVLFVEALGDYVVVNTRNKKYTLLTTMKQIEQKLPEQKFMRVHRSYIINIDHVETFDGGLMVIDKKLISVGKSYKKNITAKLNLV
jgi:DNA-binding LytR/AlgR family response regulator